MSHNTPTKKPPKGGGAGGCFLACFGSSHSNYYDDGGGDIINSKENSKPSLDGSIIIKVPKRRKWFSWVSKQPSATKTVPLDSNVEKKSSGKSLWNFILTPINDKRSRNNMVKMKKKGEDRSQPLPDHANNSVLSPAPESTATPAAQITSKTRSNNDQQSTKRNKKSSTKPHLDTIEEATSQESPPPPTPTPTPTPTTTATTNLLATTNNSGFNSPAASKKSKDTVVGRRVDSVVGMSIILVMLLIMLVWGKVCAILCTSAWFYFVTRFRIKDGSESSDKVNKNGSLSSLGDQVDINSQFYKKKIVLEGILQRKNNHRTNSVVFNSK